MIEDDISSILKKTSDYYRFIRDNISSRRIELKDEDIKFLKNIESYLAVTEETQSQPHHNNSQHHQTLISTCITYLKGMDAIAIEYKISPG